MAIIHDIPPIQWVPEHSLLLMEAMSGGSPFCCGEYLFFTANDWLMAIGYPLHGKFQADDFSDAVKEAQTFTSAGKCFAIAPQMPENLADHIVATDRFYLLDVQKAIPAKLRGPVKKAASLLHVSEGMDFTADHRKLWNEFLDRQAPAMTPRVAELYRQTPAAIKKAQGSLRLLDARDMDGHLTASLLLDYGPKRFCSYIIGAHSRLHYAPHAMDLLFASMLANARNAGKRYIHLGLGVNEGILRFKRKWGARPYFPYVMAEWETGSKTNLSTTTRDEAPAGRDLLLAMLRSSGTQAKNMVRDAPTTRPFAMLWELRKNGRSSWIGGTAHFFCHSFEPSFKKLFQNVDTVIFEGPLDAAFMAKVDEHGKKLPDGTPALFDNMTEAQIISLEKTVLGPQGRLAKCLGMEYPSTLDIRHLLKTGRYWYTFFKLWTAFLERQGWHESVDMEAWRTARAMGKTVIGMESLEEQLESLGSLPMHRVLRFFAACKTWKSRSRQNLKAYLAGDLEKMMGSSAEFPTRTEHVIGRRDQRFRERMREYLEKGGCAVFVGCAHMVNLRHMLAEDGFSIRQRPFGIWPKLHLSWRDRTRPDEKVTW